MKVFALVLLAFALFSVSPATAQAAHSVTLTWLASGDAASNPTLNYNVYRAASACPAAGPPANQVKIASAVAVLTYNDSSVSLGQVYCYTVRAQLNGTESLDSNTAAAVILPSPPSGLQSSTK